MKYFNHHNLKSSLITKLKTKVIPNKNPSFPIAQ